MFCVSYFAQVEEGWSDKEYQGPSPFSGYSTQHSGRFQAQLRPLNLYFVGFSGQRSNDESFVGSYAEGISHQGGFQVNNTDREDRGEASGAGEGMEVEFTQPDLDASAALMKSLFTQKEIDAAMGTTSAAPTSFRMKFYTKLPESDKWEFANECA